jgi:hypothetical protein
VKAAIWENATPNGTHHSVTGTGKTGSQATPVFEFGRVANDNYVVAVAGLCT